jgi:hypothetical protein
MIYKEDVERIIQKRQREIERFTKAIERADEKIREKEEEILVMKDLAESLPEAQPALPGPVGSGKRSG